VRLPRPVGQGLEVGWHPWQASVLLDWPGGRRFTLVPTPCEGAVSSGGERVGCRHCREQPHDNGATFPAMVQGQLTTAQTGSRTSTSVRRSFALMPSTKPYRSAVRAHLGATPCYRRAVVMTGGKGLAVWPRSAPPSRLPLGEPARGRQRARQARATPPAPSPAADIGARGPGTGLAGIRSPAQGRPARRLAPVPMPGETSRTGVGRTVFPAPGGTRQARPSGGSVMLGEKAVGMDARAPTGFVPDGSRAPGRPHQPGNLRRCRAGRERAG
jgi:hypothetical protein